MQKITAFSIAFLSVMASLQAQSPPAQPNYEPKVYLDPQGYTYVQRQMPLYLKFSTSPNGENYPLKSVAHPEDTEPMYLEAEGIHYLRHRWAVNPETQEMVQPQREVMIEIYADGIAPRTRHRFSGAKSHTAGGTLYFGPGLQFSLQSTDAVSGVEATQYALDGAFQAYQNAVSVSGEGAKNLHYYAVDNVGNAEQTRSVAFTTDLSAPQSNHRIDGIVHQNNILAPSSRFSLSAQDNLSGVQYIFYRYDEGRDQVYSNSIGMGGLGDGEHQLEYYARDQVGNEAQRQRFSFYLDRIAPEANFAIEGDQYQGNYTYISARTKIALSATDNKAGVDFIRYRIDQGAYQNYAQAFNMPDAFGLHSFGYDATDKVENKASAKSKAVFVDNRAPNTRIDYGRPQFFDRDTLFITKDTEISLPRSDQGSGIQSTEYRIDGASWQNYAPFSIPGEGFHQIAFRSTDRVNNQEQEKQSEVFVDNSPPEIFVNFSIKPIGQRKGHNVYPNYVRMYIAATDKHTGTQNLMYSVNDGPMTEYSSPRTLDASEKSVFVKNKKYRVKVQVKDKLGNSAEKLIEFYVGPEQD